MTMTTDLQRYAIYDRIMKVYLSGENSLAGWEWSADGRQAETFTRSDAHQARAAILSTPASRGGRAFPDAISIITAEEVQVLPAPSVAPTSAPPASSNVLLYHPTVEAFYAKHTEAAGADAGSVTRTFTWDYDPLKAMSMSLDEAEQRRQEWQMPALVIMVPSEATRVAAVRQAAAGLARLPNVGPVPQPQQPVQPPQRQVKKEYKVLVTGGVGPVSSQAIDLVHQVEAHLEDGWQPLGGIASNGGTLLQAMGRAR
jgi:hypothetical protein